LWLSWASLLVSVVAALLIGAEYARTHPAWAVSAANGEFRERLIAFPDPAHLLPRMAIAVATLVAMAAVPALVRRPFLRYSNLGAAIASAPFLLGVGRMAILPSLHRAKWGAALIFLTPSLILGVLSDLGVLVVVRWALRRCDRAGHWLSGIASCLALLVVGFAVSGAPVYLLRNVGGALVVTPLLLLTISVPANVLDIVGVGLFAGWIVLLLLHKLFWPILGGLIERVYELVPDRRVLIGAGFSLLLFAQWARVTNALKVVASILVSG